MGKVKKFFKTAYKVLLAIGAASESINNVTNTYVDTVTAPDRLKSLKADAEKRQRDLDNYDADRALRQTDVYSRMKTSNISYINDYGYNGYDSNNLYQDDLDIYNTDQYL